MISTAIRKPGGSEAVKMQITQQFIDELGIVLKSANISVVPGQLANIKGVFEGVGEVADIMSDDKSQNHAYVEEVANIMSDDKSQNQA